LSRHHLQATAREAGQRRRALSCAAGAQPRAAPPGACGRGEHGEHPPFDAPCAPWHRAAWRHGTPT